MTDNDSTFFTDEEIFKELENLGINDVTPETFEKMKQDLIDMVSSDASNFELYDKEIKNYSSPEIDNASLHSLRRNLFNDHSPNVNSLSKSYDYNAGSRTKAPISKNFRRTLKFSKLPCSCNDISIDESLSATSNLPNIHENYEVFPTDFQNTSNKEFLNAVGRLELGYKSLPSQEDRLLTSYNSLPQLGDFTQTNKSMQSKSPILKLENKRLSQVKKLGDISSESDSLLINNSLEVESILGDYRKRLKYYKLGNRLRQKNIQDSDNGESSRIETSLNSSVIVGKLKRKILRYKDGRPFVTEEFIDIPNIFSSCYPSSLSTTNSYTDLSFKSNSSTGSIVAVSPESTPRSTLSKTQISKPPLKKSDPVAMYNYYKKFWDNFKPPGEKSHQKLRWAVRDKMLEFS